MSETMPPRALALNSFMPVIATAVAGVAALYLIERAQEGRRAVKLASEYVERYLLAVERCDRLEARVERLGHEIERLLTERRRRR